MKLNRVLDFWPRQGKKVEAIKLVREFTGAALKEAKDFVEEF